MKHKLMDTHRREMILAQVVEENKNEIASWMTGRTFSKDPFLKKQYLEGMVECIRKKGDFVSYRVGVHYASSMEEKDVEKELAREMILKYPVQGRLIRLFDKILGKLI